MSDWILPAISMFFATLVLVVALVACRERREGG